MSGKRRDSESWTAAKEQGDVAELAVAECFKARACDVTKTLGKDGYDLLVQTKLEVKHDLKSTETGNAAFEVSQNGRPSGIVATKASHWVHVVGTTGYMARVEQFRALLKSGNFPEKPVGDDGLAQVRLVPLDALRNLDFVQQLDLAKWLP